MLMGLLPGKAYLAKVQSIVARGPIQDFFSGIVAEKRDRKRERFKGHNDAGRLVVLGIIVVNLAAIAIADSVYGQLIIDYRPGMASLFGGLVFAIIIIRLGRPSLYVDGVAVGLLHVSLGQILIGDQHLVGMWTSIGYHLILITCGVATAWIGLTLPVEQGRPSFFAGGLASLAVGIYAILDRITVHIVEPDIILATELVLLGLSTCSLGLILGKKT